MYSGNVEISRQLFEGIGKQRGIDGINPLDPGRRLHRHSRDASHAVAGVGGDGLDIGSDSGPGGGVESRNRKDDGWLIGHGLRFANDLDTTPILPSISHRSGIESYFRKADPKKNSFGLARLTSS